MTWYSARVAEVSFGALVIIVVMIVSTINEVVTKRRKGQSSTGAPPRPGQGSRPHPREGAPESGARPEVRVPRHPVEESARILLPDDLWAILTGEQPSAPRVPEPAPEPAEAEWAEEAGHAAQLPADELEWEESSSAASEHYEWRSSGEATIGLPSGTDTRGRDTRAIPVRAPRPLTARPHRELHSLEDSVPTDEERHDAFHRRIDADAARSGTNSYQRRRAARHRELRRGIILREVLGPPRGLEDPF
jgi:hypothetical protein